jgi:dihydroneopterin aldolase
VADYESLLRDLAERVGEEDASLIKTLLEKVLGCVKRSTLSLR